MNELGIWALQEDGTAEAVNAVSKVDLEDRLEGMLVQRPDMLEPGIQLVGRQTLADGRHPLDLLGVGTDGRLVVFELKRERLTREAVTQCIDYASALDAKDPEEELPTLIAEQSGKDGIDQIDKNGFRAWYEEQFKDKELSDLLPPRLVLVSLGIDARAERMARFLQACGVDISVLTFYGFQHGGETLLARQVEVEHDPSPPSHSRQNKNKNPREALERRLSERGLSDLFEAVKETMDTTLSDASMITNATSINFSMRFGSGLRRILGIRVDDTGLSLEFDARPNYDGQPEIYEPADLSMLEEKAKQVGWSPRPHAGWGQGNNFTLFIKDDKDWEQKRSAVTEFLKEAAELRLKAPPTDAS